MEKLISRAKQVFIRKPRDCEQFTQAILKGRSRQDESEGAFKLPDHIAGLRFPVLDALTFIQNDQIPRSRFDRGQVPQHLLIIANRKESVAGVLLTTFVTTSEYDLGGAAAESPDLTSPL